MIETPSFSNISYFNGRGILWTEYDNSMQKSMKHEKYPQNYYGNQTFDDTWGRTLSQADILNLEKTWKGK